MTDMRRAVGRYGETLACRYLSEHGYEILERNWRCARGELDIIARQGDVLVVCEVKTRRTATFGEPFEAVTPRKARRLRTLTMMWLDARPERQWFAGVRIDVVSVQRPPTGPARITHLQAAA